MIVIIAGSRHFYGYGVLLDVMHGARLEPTRILSGAATGVDRLGERWARAMGVEVDPFPANWKALGASAGPVRNLRMVLRADALVALPCPCSTGTRDIIRKAGDEGLVVIVREVVCGVAATNNLPRG